MRAPFSLIAGLAAAALSSVAAAQPAEPLAPERIYRIHGDFLGKTAGEPAEDMSGIACIPPGSSPIRHCLVVDNETQFAQVAIIERDRITAGRKYRLIGPKANDDTLGAEPDIATCPEGQKKFKELDGEGVAYAKPYFYVVGSHGCTRGGEAFRPSLFILARLRVDDRGRAIGADGRPTKTPSEGNGIETTYRLTDVLRNARTVGEYFGKGLGAEADGGENGLNIEGIAVVGDRLLAGLRAPSLDGKAFLVPASLADLFAPGHAPSGAAPDPIPLALGKDLGIRDLATLDDGRLLILAGSAQKQERPYSILLLQPADGQTPKHLVDLEEVDAPGGGLAGAEGLVVLDSTRDEARVLVLFDGLPNGGPREYRVPLR